MPVYEYVCDPCKVKVEAYRHFDDSDKCPVCPLCVSPTRKIISKTTQVTPRPWYEKQEGVLDPRWSAMDATDRLRTMKEDEARWEKSWEGKTPSRNSYQTVSANEIYRSLSAEDVGRELASMSEQG